MRSIQSSVALALLLSGSSLGCGGDSSGPGGEPSPDGGTDSTSTSSDGGPDDSTVGDVADGSDGADASAETGATCNWTPITNGLKGGSIAYVAFDPRIVGAVYAVSGSKLFRSADGGTTWMLQGDAGSPLGQLAFPPGKAEVVVAASQNGIVRSADSGKTWSVMALSGLRPSAILIHPAAPERWFASVVGTGIFRSTDAGMSWTIPSAIPPSDVTALVGDPTNADIVVGSSILLNSAGGYSSSGAMLRTTNNGGKWDTVFSGADIRYMRACAADAKILYAGMSAGILKSTDGGASWGKLSALGGNYIADVIPSATNCNTVFASAPFEGIRRSLDGGATFSGVLSSLPGTAPDLGPYRMAVDPTKADRVAAAMLDGLFFSADKGDTWTQADAQFSLAISGLAAGSDGVLWASTSGSGVWKRSKLDAAWFRVTLPFSRAFSLGVSPSDPKRVFVGGWPEIWRTTDGAGFSFTGSSGNAQAWGFGGADVVYAATQTQGVLKSANGGASFAPINGDLTPWVTPVGTFIDAMSIVAHPNGSKDLVIGTRGKGIFRSTNEGVNWVPATGPVTDTAVSCLAAVPGTGAGSLFACVADKGVARSDDGGATWTAFSAGLSTTAATGLAYDAVDKTLYVTTSDGLFFTKDFSSWTPFDAKCFGGASLASPLVVGTGAGRSLVVRSGATPMWRALP